MSDFKIVQLLNPIQVNTSIHPMGVYSASTTYGVGDSVSFGNSSYVAILPTTGNDPTNTTYWQLLATASTNKLSATARNQTGSTIPAGTVVYFSGVSGNVPILALSQANNELNSTKTIGITASSIANNANGEIVIFGLAQSLNTSAFTAGSALWLSPTVPGGMTMTKPSAPDHMVFIGFCSRSHPTDGTIEIKIQNGFELEELHNVAISSLVDNQVLKYDAPNSLWKNETLTSSDVGLGNVLNVDTTNPANITQDANHRFVTDVEKNYWNNKQESFGPGLSSQYLRGDGSWQTLDKTAVGLSNVPNVDATQAANISTDSTHRFVTDAQLNSFLTENNAKTVTNKDFDWLTCRFVSLVNNAFVKFDVTGCTGAYQNVLDFNSTFNNTYTFPNNTGTVALTSDVSSAVSNKVDKTGDTLTGTLYSNGTTGFYNSVVTSNSSGSGTAQQTYLNDTSEVLSLGISGSTFTPVYGVPANSSYVYTTKGLSFVTTTSDGVKWIQGGSQVASLVAGSFTANSIDATPINLMGLTSITPATSNYAFVSDGSNNYKASLNEMPVSVPQNINSIVNAIIFG